MRYKYGPNSSAIGFTLVLQGLLVHFLSLMKGVPLIVPSIPYLLGDDLSIVPTCSYGIPSSMV